MTIFVLDASIAMAWCYPDEHSEFAYSVLDRIQAGMALVPSVWSLEIANALAAGERRKRVTAGDIAYFLGLIDGLAIETDPQTAHKALNDTLHLARKYHLSAYDAAYLELAAREGISLATLDQKLRSAAKALGVGLLPKLPTNGRKSDIAG